MLAATVVSRRQCVCCAGAALEESCKRVCLNSDKTEECLTLKPDIYGLGKEPVRSCRGHHWPGERAQCQRDAVEQRRALGCGDADEGKCARRAGERGLEMKELGLSMFFIASHLPVLP